MQYKRIIFDIEFQSFWYIRLNMLAAIQIKNEAVMLYDYRSCQKWNIEEAWQWWHNVNVTFFVAFHLRNFECAEFLRCFSIFFVIKTFLCVSNWNEFALEKMKENLLFKLHKTEEFLIKLKFNEKSTIRTIIKVHSFSTC